MSAHIQPEVVPVDDEGPRRVWFVSSGSQHGVWYRATYAASDERLECSCQAGRIDGYRIDRGESPKGCRHLRAVVDFEQKRAVA